jgi:Ca2+/Na+ antiporter
MTVNTDTVAFLIRNLEENWILARQAEDKRAMIALTVLILASFTLGAFFISDRTPLNLLLILLGLYGLLTTAKLYERSQYHILRARKIRARLDELCPNAQLEPLYKLTEEEHQARYPWLMNVRLNAIWQCFYVVLIILGSALLLRSLL